MAIVMEGELWETILWVGVDIKKNDVNNHNGTRYTTVPYRDAKLFNCVSSKMKYKSYNIWGPIRMECQVNRFGTKVGPLI